MSEPTPHRIGGRYQVGELLGRGGMAEVRKGIDIRLGRTVAIKRLRTDLASDPTFQARFRREAQSSASLNHPAIVAVYDTGEEMSTDGTDVAQPYIVMEYVAGRTLREILREGRKILPERALEITASVLSALDYSHRAGIIHRDIKPGNVMLTPAGDVKVMDFGIARAVSDASSTMTQTAAVVGTAQYLSPEQARGETVDPRSDVYSTGCLLYELLTGRPPFVGESPVAVAYQHVREPAVPPSMYDDELDDGIDAIAMKALAKPLGERYQSAADMRADIERYLAGKPVQAPAVGAAAAATTFLPVDNPPPGPQPTYAAPASHTAIQQRVAADEPEPRSNKGVWVVLGLLLLALLTFLAIKGPDLLDGGADQVQVPTVTGKNETAAERALEQEGLSLGTVTREADPQVEKGLVIRQDPQAGDMVDPGTRVNVVISLGPPDVEVPDVVGDPRDQAAAEIRDKNLRVRSVEEESDKPAGEVIRMSPEPGTKVAPKTQVTLFYSDGPETVPDVTGKTQAEAESLIKAAGFEVDVVEDPASTAPKGTVVEQSPKAGRDLPKGGTVTIVVSTAEPSPSPSVTPSESPSASP